MQIKEITPEELNTRLKRKDDIQLIDVREPDEFIYTNIGGELIPLNEVILKSSSISREKDVIVICRSGRRSAEAIISLQQEYGFNNLYNLKGGILAWSDEVDPAVLKY